jgi:hypothetical protein
MYHVFLQGAWEDFLTDQTLADHEKAIKNRRGSIFLEVRPPDISEGEDAKRPIPAWQQQVRSRNNAPSPSLPRTYTRLHTIPGPTNAGRGPGGSELRASTRRAMGVKAGCQLRSLQRRGKPNTTAAGVCFACFAFAAARVLFWPYKAPAPPSPSRWPAGWKRLYGPCTSTQLPLPAQWTKRSAKRTMIITAA